VTANSADYCTARAWRIECCRSIPSGNERQGTELAVTTAVKLKSPIPFCETNLRSHQGLSQSQLTSGGPKNQSSMGHTAKALEGFTRRRSIDCAWLCSHALVNLAYTTVKADAPHPAAFSLPQPRLRHQPPYAGETSLCPAYRPTPLHS
jgi:hypothetical protein